MACGQNAPSCDPLKEPNPILLDFFQSFCDLVPLRKIMFFWSAFWNQAHIPCHLEENNKNVSILLITVVTTI